MSIDVKTFGRLSDGTAVECYTLKNRNGMLAEFLTYGCRIAKLFVPDRAGKAGNVVLGHDTLEEYTESGDVLGAVVGRYANRIAGAHFEIAGTPYDIVKNEGENSLHSAPGGFQDRVWRVRSSSNDDDAPSVTFAYHSPAGECGFPGNVDAEVTYTLSTDNALIIDYRGKTDLETPFNPTNHSFFNLTGNAGKDVLSHKLRIEADSITLTDDALIPTGKFLPVAGTPFDFRLAKTIGQDIRAQEHSLKYCGGYDHNFVLGPSESVRRVAELSDGASGRTMLVFTDLPGIQIYTANSFSAGAKGCGGVPLKAHHAVCLETQFYPNSVNEPAFPYANLKPEKPFHSTTIYKFTIG